MEKLITKETVGIEIVKVFDFLYKGTSNDQIKPVFCGFFFEDNKIVTTDSRRLHIATDIRFIDLFEDGVFQVDKIKGGYCITKGIEGTFPNYRHIMPNERDYIQEFYKIEYNSKIDMLGVKIGRLLYNLPYVLNIDFVLDMLSVKNVDYDLTVKILNAEDYERSLAPVLFTGTLNDIKIDTLIMPLKAKED